MSKEPTNVEVGAVIGVSHAAVSRYRDGIRVPRMATMLVIADKYNWPITSQAKAHAAGTWHQGFERAICRGVRKRRGRVT